MLINIFNRKSEFLIANRESLIGNHDSSIENWPGATNPGPGRSPRHPCGPSPSAPSRRSAGLIPGLGRNPRPTYPLWPRVTSQKHPQPNPAKSRETNRDGGCEKQKKFKTEENGVKVEENGVEIEEDRPKIEGNWVECSTVEGVVTTWPPRCCHRGVSRLLYHQVDQRVVRCRLWVQHSSF